jgi:hypothetical protein
MCSSYSDMSLGDSNEETLDAHVLSANCRFMAPRSTPPVSSRCQARVCPLRSGTNLKRHQPSTSFDTAVVKLSDTSVRFVFAVAYSDLLSQPCNHSSPVLHPCHLTVLSSSAHVSQKIAFSGRLADFHAAANGCARLGLQLCHLPA